MKIGNIAPEWKDMSKYVVHFSTESADGCSAYDNAISILYERNIEARHAFGAGRLLPPALKSVCFSEIPLHLLRRLADKRGPHGIGFRKDFLVERGGGPILYAYKDTEHAKAIDTMVSGAIHDPSNPVWKLAPFIDLPGIYNSSKYFFEWEREWRVVEDFSFEPSDVAFLIIPEDLHDVARNFFDGAERDNIGPNYKCKFVDPYWEDDQIQNVLKD